MADRWVCVALLLTVALSGCMTDGKTDDTVGDPPTTDDVVRPERLDWSLTDCEAAILIFDVPKETIRPFLPAGFEPLAPVIGLAGLFENPTDTGSFGVEMIVCADGAGLNGSVGPLVYGSHFAMAAPPESLRDEDAALHFVKWDVLVPDAPRRDLLVSVGVPAYDGNVTFDAFSLQASVGSVRGTMDMNGTHPIAGETAAPGPLESSFIEYTETPDGLVAWKTAMVATAVGMGQGTYTAESGTFAAQILGTGEVQGTLMLARMSFTGGEIRIPDGA